MLYGKALCLRYCTNIQKILHTCFLIKVKTKKIMDVCFVDYFSWCDL